MRRLNVNREDHIGAAFAAHAELIHRDLLRRTQPEFSDLVDDACAYAWHRLLVRDDIALDAEERFVGWVYVTALHQHRRLTVDRRKELSLDAWDGDIDQRDDAPLEALPAAKDDLQAIVEARARLRLLDELSPQRREAILLRATGHVYSEIGELTALTPRQVRRHLDLGTKQLRDLDRARSEALQPKDSVGRGAKTRAHSLEEVGIHEKELDLDL